MIIIFERKDMRLVHFFILLTCFLNINLSGQDANAVIGDYKSIDSLLNIEYNNRPGIVVLASEKGQIVFRNSYGLADIEKGIPLSSSMVFEIGSMTKQFTSTAILQLIEEGLIQLNDPIQKYVPYFPEKEYPITI